MSWRGFWRRDDEVNTAVIKTDRIQNKNQARSMSNGGSEHTAGLIYLGKTDSKKPTPAAYSVSSEFLVLLEDDVVHAAAFRNAGVLDDRCFYAVLCDELLELVRLRIIFRFELERARNALEQVEVVQSVLFALVCGSHDTVVGRDLADGLAQDHGARPARSHSP